MKAVDITGKVLNKYKEFKEQILANYDTAKEKTLEKIIKDTEPYVPYRTGKLTESSVMNVPSSLVSYTAPYASFAFNPVAPSGKPKQYDRSVHKLAQGYPIQAAFEDHETDWAAYFEDELLHGVK